MKMKPEPRRTPELRFPEFDQDLARRLLGEIVTAHNSGIYKSASLYGTGANIIGVSDLYSISSVDGQTFNRVPLTDEEISKFSLDEGDLLYAESSLVREGIAKTVYVTKKGVGTAFEWHTRRFKVDFQVAIPSYLHYNLEAPPVRRRIMRVATQTALTGITTNDYFSTTIWLPDKSEQTKVAGFLSPVDEKIGQLARKREILLKYKKGVMQQIFDQKIRFKDEKGNDFPDWEEKRIEELFTITRGNVLPMNRVRPRPSGEFVFPVYSSQTFNKGLSGFFDKYLFEDCITWTTDGAGAGDVNFRRGKFYCTNVCGVLQSEVGYANQFLAELLNTLSRRHVSYVGNPKLMNNVIAKIRVRIPSSMEEQRLISEFFEALDTKINLVSQQLVNTKAFKKGLLQQLFV